jgi:hypothetical protein
MEKISRLERKRFKQIREECNRRGDYNNCQRRPCPFEIYV